MEVLSNTKKKPWSDLQICEHGVGGRGHWVLMMDTLLGGLLRICPEKEWFDRRSIFLSRYEGM
jgi:hypothetical protein